MLKSHGYVIFPYDFGSLLCLWPDKDLKKMKKVEQKVCSMCRCSILPGLALVLDCLCTPSDPPPPIQCWDMAANSVLNWWRRFCFGPPPPHPMLKSAAECPRLLPGALPFQHWMGGRGAIATRGVKARRCATPALPHSAQKIFIFPILIGP